MKPLAHLRGNEAAGATAPETAGKSTELQRPLGGVRAPPHEMELALSLKRSLMGTVRKQSAVNAVNVPDGGGRPRTRFPSIEHEWRRNSVNAVNVPDCGGETGDALSVNRTRIAPNFG